MKVWKLALIGVMLVMVGFVLGAQAHRPRRVGMIIGIKPERIADYKALHADSNAGVRDLLAKYNMRNFSIYLQKLDDGKQVLFGYYEYCGTNYEADMSALANEERNIEWLRMTDPMQVPLSGHKTWANMEEVYHNN